MAWPGVICLSPRGHEYHGCGSRMTIGTRRITLPVRSRLDTWPIEAALTWQESRCANVFTNWSGVICLTPKGHEYHGCGSRVTIGTRRITLPVRSRLDTWPIEAALTWQESRCATVFTNWSRVICLTPKGHEYHGCGSRVTIGTRRITLPVRSRLDTGPVEAALTWQVHVVQPYLQICNIYRKTI
jgi:hypothetical protein